MRKNSLIYYNNVDSRRTLLVLIGAVKAYDVQRDGRGGIYMTKIIFEDPNTQDDTERYLPKFLAELILLKLKAEQEDQRVAVGQD